MLKDPVTDNSKEKEFMEAYQRYADAIYRHCYFRVYNEDLAKDLTQETFIKTWKYISEGKEVKSIKAFLYRVAVNIIIDHSRKKTALVLDQVKENEASIRLDSVESAMIDNLEIKEIVAMLDNLEEKYRQVIVMRYIDQLSPPEIAKVLGISTNAVSVKLNYALKKLRSIIKTTYHES
jgi:RNA polymerase sigma-70 factor (ECF subfamily)